MLNILRQPNFARLWTGGLISLTGDRVLSTALPFYIYQQTGSTLATSGLILATIAPRFLLGSIVGVYVDRWNRKHIMIVANLVRAVVLLGLAAAPATVFSLAIYLVVLLEAILSTFFDPAENALLPTLVDEDQLMTANTLNALNNTLARLIGPALGGVLLAIAGINTVILFDILSYLVAALLIAGITRVPRADESHSADSPSGNSVLLAWRDGFRYMRQTQVVAILFLVLGLTTFAGTMLDPLIAPFVNDDLHADASILGWMLTAQGVGGLLSGLVIGQWVHKLRPALLMGVSALLAGILLLIVFNVPLIPVAIGLHFLLGLPLVGSRAGTQTLLQLHIPDAYRGRVFGALGTMGALLELISVSGAGILGEMIGIRPLLNFSALLTCFTGMLTLYLLRRRKFEPGVNS